MFGTAFGLLVQHLGFAGPAGAYGLAGIGTVFAGVAGAPIIMFELTGEYSIILPLMPAIVLATGRCPAGRGGDGEQPLAFMPAITAPQPAMRRCSCWT
jgi:hypothetical protein